MTFEEIKQAVKSMNIFPNQLFTEDDLKNDNVFGELVKQADSLSDKEKDFQKQIGEKDDEIKSLKRNISEGDAHKKLENILPTFETDGKKLTEKQKGFINLEFNPKNFEEFSDEKLTDFVNESLKKYPDYVSVVGDKKDDNPGSKDDDNKGESGSGEEQKDDVDQVVEDVFK